jgi:saxitoxin biosynthesis operon SxtJ-like protein
MTASTRKVQNRERSFGISVGAVLMLIAVVLLWRGRIARGEVIGAVGAMLFALGYLRPALLKYPSNAWWALAGLLGWVNARVLLSLLFFLLLTPVSVIWRVTGKDPLSRRRETWRGWQAYPERYRNPRHYERMF